MCDSGNNTEDKTVNIKKSFTAITREMFRDVYIGQNVTVEQEDHTMSKATINNVIHGIENGKRTALAVLSNGGILNFIEVDKLPEMKGFKH